MPAARHGKDRVGAEAARHVLNIGNPVEGHELILYAVGFVRAGRPSDLPATTAMTHSANRYTTANKAWQPHKGDGTHHLGRAPACNTTGMC
jgi:hypothetical protein